jgi:hypothetical protein
VEEARVLKDCDVLRAASPLLLGQQASVAGGLDASRLAAFTAVPPDDDDDYAYLEDVAFHGGTEVPVRPQAVDLQRLVARAWQSMRSLSERFGLPWPPPEPVNVRDLAGCRSALDQAAAWCEAGEAVVKHRPPELPLRPGEYRIQTQVYQLDPTPLQRKLLDSLWDGATHSPKGSVSVDPVLSSVYGPDAYGKEEALEQAQKGLNRKLLKRKVPMRVSRRTDYGYWIKLLTPLGGPVGSQPGEK